MDRWVICDLGPELSSIFDLILSIGFYTVTQLAPRGVVSYKGRASNPQTVTVVLVFKYLSCAVYLGTIGDTVASMKSSFVGRSRDGCQIIHVATDAWLSFWVYLREL